MPDEIPETDLVKIAEREVIEAARLYAHGLWFVESGLMMQAIPERTDNLLKAVTLLESREEDQRRLQRERQKKEIEK